MIAKSLALAALLVGCRAADVAPTTEETPLPAPRTSSSISVESAFGLRKPVHAFGPGDVSLADASQLMWSSRAAPAMATMPLDVYAVRADSVMRYAAATHKAHVVVPHDVRKAIAQSSGEPVEVRAAPLFLVFVAQPALGRPKYGDRAERFAAIAAGHAAQNVLLQAAALGLQATPLALFDDDIIRDALVLPREHVPLHIIAVGPS